MADIVFDATMKAEFADEFSGRLDDLVHLLIEAESTGDGASLIADLFRAAHSLKGLAALAGLSHAKDLTHELEGVFERVRGGLCACTPAVVAASFSACDQLRHLLHDFLAGGAEQTDTTACLVQLRQLSATGEIAEEFAAEDPEPVTPATPAVAGTSAAVVAPSPSRLAPELEMLRIDPARLDAVLNLSSELVIARARLGEQFRLLGTLLGATQGSEQDQPNAVRPDHDVVQGLAQVIRTIQRLSSALQTEAVRLRMVPVGPALRRLERVLRDACRATGHEARLMLSGERTELDKKLIDELIDPLTHLIRNAVDHGIESAEERQQCRKARRGKVAIDATHESGRIVLRIRDDGRGIDPVRLRAAVAAKGLLPEEQAVRLSDREALDWIFASGFSTAAKVTDISGRGVGLDIVRSRIAALNGTLEVESQVGEGTTFTISLPLTLAMVRCLLVEVDGGSYALPLRAVREVIRLEASQVRHVVGKEPHLEVRRELLPLLQPGRTQRDIAQVGGWAVIARAKDQGLAIAVDRVLREEELVIKSLSPELCRSSGATGAAVLGNGDIALLLDITLVANRRLRGTEVVA